MTPPRFIPFDAMTDGEQREHLRRVHGYAWSSPAFIAPHAVHGADHRHKVLSPLVLPHTHDKPARDRASQRSNG